MRSQSRTTGSVKIFFSYSHKDEKLRDELAKHLSILKRQGVIEEWHDRRIGAGREWQGEINTQLEEADIILLLVSPDFIASDYCYDVEVKRAMERHDSGEARVIPVILRSVAWERAVFRKLQALPKDARPVMKWPDQDEAFESIARGIQGVVEELEIKSLLERFREARIKSYINHDFDAKIKLGTRILALDADHAIRKEMAKVYFERGHHLWREAKGLKVSELKLPWKRAVLTRRQYEQILSDYGHSVELCPDDPYYYLMRGDLHAEESNPEEFGSLVRDPEPFDYKRALADYTRAIELDPHNGQYFYARARLNDPKINSLLRAFDERPGSPDDEERVKKLQAQRDFQRAIDLGYIDEKTGFPKITRRNE